MMISDLEDDDLLQIPDQGYQCSPNTIRDVLEIIVDC